MACGLCIEERLEGEGISLYLCGLKVEHGQRTYSKEQKCTGSATIPVCGEESYAEEIAKRCPLYVNHPLSSVEILIKKEAFDEFTKSF